MTYTKAHSTVLILFIFILCACSKHEKQHVIGVSQCSEDIWRDKLNDELRMGAYSHNDTELRFVSAGDNDQKQVEQINHFIDEGIDLLIVSPNQVATITPAIDRAFDQGIPVIVFDRKTSSKKFTAYIGADNHLMGYEMGEYIAQQLGGHGNVMEIMGLKGSSPAIDRHLGFVEALSHYPDIHLVASLQGDWTENSAYNAVTNYQGPLSHIDFVFGQNDRMALGARKAFIERFAPKATDYDIHGYDLVTPRFCGIDGLPGKNGGMECVRDGLLDATYIYPTHGDEVLQLAIDILKGKPYQKENPLKAALVTKDNAHVLLMQHEEIERQTGYLNQLHNMADDYLRQIGYQRLLIILSAGIIALLLITAFLTLLYYRQRSKISRERALMTRQQLDFYTQASHELRTPLTLIEGPLAQLAATTDMQNASEKAIDMLDIVQRNTKQLSQVVNKILDVLVDGQWPSQTEPINTTLLESRPTQAFNNTNKTYSILVVDDNDDIRTYLHTILNNQYNICEAANGQQGLEVAQREVPDLIISDVMMPVMNGLEFCQHVKDNYITSHIPVILLTARALSKHQVEGYRSGADGYITKPFQPDVLLARIDNLLCNRILLKNLFASAEHQPTCLQSEKEQNCQQIQNEHEFITRFRQIVEQHLGDSDLNVETIGQQLGLSRVQLYRKVKALTDMSPVEMVRKTRLVKAHELLQTTDKSISEVAYEVGFSAPSYFTKCFKEEYGTLPGNVKR